MQNEISIKKLRVLGELCERSQKATGSELKFAAWIAHLIT
jgi:hypothetical protein